MNSIPMHNVRVIMLKYERGVSHGPDAPNFLRQSVRCLDGNLDANVKYP